MPKLPPAGSGTLSLATPEPVAYGQQIAFNHTGDEDLSNPRLWVTAHQNGELVYGEGTSPDAGVKLGGGSSQWVSNGGGPAECHAQLYYILNKNGTAEWKGGGQQQGGTVVLATCSFNAEG